MILQCPEQINNKYIFNKQRTPLCAAEGRGFLPLHAESALTTGRLKSDDRAA